MTDDWVESDTLPVLDRSELELWGTCPHQARLMGMGKAIRENFEMRSGTEAHECFSAGVAEYLGTRGEARVASIVDVVMGRAATSRPDVQPDVIQAIRASVWSWAKFLADYEDGLSPKNILRYDGGRDERSGQLAMDLEYPRVRITSEIDLLYAGPSPDVIHEVDYKTGNKQWTARMVGSSFQFQMHALLIWHNYPKINAVETTIWNTRTNAKAWRVMFNREQHEYPIRMRISQAAVQWMKYHDQPSDNVPAWAESSKCNLCQVAQHCRVNQETFTTPEDMLRQYVVNQAAAKILKGRLTEIVRETGKDVVTPEGDAFGEDKPSTRADPCGAYRIETESDDPETQHD